MPLSKTRPSESTGLARVNTDWFCESKLLIYWKCMFYYKIHISVCTRIFSTEYCGNKRLHHQNELMQEFSPSLISRVEIEWFDFDVRLLELLEYRNIPRSSLLGFYKIWDKLHLRRFKVINWLPNCYFDKIIFHHLKWNWF